MITKTQILMTDQKLIEQVYQFFLSKVINPTLFEEVKSVLIQPKIKKEEKNRIEMGMFSTLNFMIFMNQTGRITGGIKMNQVKLVIERMVENFMLYHLDYLIGTYKTYKPNDKYVAAIQELGVIDNILLGFEYIIQKYRKSVIKIENTASNEDKDIGTGFITKMNNQNLLITNYHVIEGAKRLRILSFEEKELDFEIIGINEEKDLAIIEIKTGLLNIKSLNLQPNASILSEIITIGYPSIPQTKEAYQVCHKGEVNSFVEDYRGNKLFLISAKTSSGNSGSPVINKSGFVVGIVARELYEKDALLEKGKLPYYGVIPSMEIMIFLSKILKNRQKDC